MTETRLPAVWLRSLAALVAFAGLLGLGGCGGGSGAPNNVFSTPGTLAVLPANAVAYSGIPMLLTISGGTPPYKAFSSNSSVVPVVQEVAGSAIALVPNTVTAETAVTITVQDTPLGATAATGSVALTVRPSPLLNSLTITPNATTCGTNAICSGQTGTATVTVSGSQGRQVRFDVVSGPYGLLTPGNPPTVVTSLIATSDSSGVASVIIQANPGAPTQFAQLRVTDITSGQQLTGNFLIQQVTDGTKILTVVPGTATITGAFKGSCSSGFSTDYFIFGGTPPYRVTSTFPNAVSLSPSTVNVSGGSFRATTNGTCVNPLTFSIVDATGLVTTATLSNVEGSTDIPVITPAALAVAPATYTVTACSGQSRQFIVTGGTTPYSATAINTLGTSVAVTGNGNGSTFTVGPLPAGFSTTTVVFTDQSAPQKSISATINCLS